MTKKLRIMNTSHKFSASWYGYQSKILCMIDDINIVYHGQSEIFFTSVKIMFSFHVSLSHLIEDNITYSWSNSGRFSKHCSSIYVEETISIFLSFKLNVRTVRRSTYIKNDTLPNIGKHLSSWVCGAAPATSPFVYSRTTSCEIHCFTQGAACPLSRCSEKRSLTVGFECMADFNYFELNRLNRIG